jgi:hypothetical protein
MMTVSSSDASNTLWLCGWPRPFLLMRWTVFLLFVLAVSAFNVELDVDALFPGSDFYSLKHAGRALNNSGTLQKRYDQARFTFFDTGLGACGKTNAPSDFV